uniref:Uncharacterized protein LOC105129971 isoform X3 n=1 Tax=Rhizophora mucronata TaxID=61149 RepID=A0A2P2ITY8_RHIMU
MPIIKQMDPKNLTWILRYVMWMLLQHHAAWWLVTSIKDFWYQVRKSMSLHLVMEEAQCHSLKIHV